MKKIRMYDIDSTKGFAILLVIMGHVLDGYITMNPEYTKDSFIWSTYNIIYSFHMGLFFIVSGFLFSNSYLVNDKITDYKRFLKQIKKILFVFFVWSVLLWFVKYSFSKYANVTLDIKELLLMFIKPLGPYWYLHSLLIYYLIFSLKFVHTIKYSYILIGCFLIACLSSILPSTDIMRITTSSYFMFFFAFGVFLQKKIKIIDLHIKRKRTFFALLLCFICSIIAISYLIDKWISCIPLVNIIIATSLSLFTLYIFRFFAPDKNSILVFIGSYCLQIYLIHCFFTGSFRTILPKIFGIENIYCSVSLNFALSFILSITIPYLLKNTKLHKLFFGF